MEGSHISLCCLSTFVTLGLCTVLLWAVSPTFRRYMPFPSSGLDVSLYSIPQLILINWGGETMWIMR
jgi:hypothetical protein